MYERLARGHATAYLNSLPPHDRLLAWFDGAKGSKALDAFETSCFSKKPGRVLKRLRPHLKPIFGPPGLIHWNKETKLVVASGYATATENHIFHLPQDAQSLYSERAVFHTEVLFRYDNYDNSVGTSTLTDASISDHAIARLIEREAFVPEELRYGIPHLLFTTALFFGAVLRTRVDRTELQSFMIPFREGALVVVLMDMDPSQARKGQERRRIFSVRTWLPEKMLSAYDMERMAGLPDESKDDFADFLRWIEGNARPWHFADTTLEGKDGKERDMPDEQAQT